MRVGSPQMESSDRKEALFCLSERSSLKWTRRARRLWILSEISLRFEEFLEKTLAVEKSIPTDSLSLSLVRLSSVCYGYL